MHLQSGSRMDSLGVRRLLQALPLANRFDSDVLVPSGSVHLDTALVDLMGRYGRISQDDFSGSDHAPSSGGGESDRKVLVRLRVERARGIGRMDLGRGADLFCVAFVMDTALASGKAVPVEGNRLFQTKVLRGRTEEDWTWNEVAAPYPPAPPARPVLPKTLPSLSKRSYFAPLPLPSC